LSSTVPRFVPLALSLGFWHAQTPAAVHLESGDFVEFGPPIRPESEYPYYRLLARKRNSIPFRAEMQILLEPLMPVI